MKRSVAQYRNIDLILWGVILSVFETMIIKAAGSWYADQLYIVSLTGAISAIVYMRWGGFGLIHSVLGGAVICINLHAGSRQWLIYCLGNCASLLILLMRKLWGADRITKNSVASVTFGILTLLFMQGGRVAVALACGYSPNEALGFFTTDTLSLVFTAVIIWIAGRLDGIFEDQRSYLIRINEANKQQEAGK